MIIKERLKKFYAHVVALFQRTEDHHIYLIAAGIAFNILIYLIPLFLMAIYFVSMFYDIDLLSRDIVNLVMQMLPPNDSTEKFVEKLIVDLKDIFAGSSVAGIIGLGSMIWLSSTLFSSIRTALNRVFSIPTPRFFLFYWIKDFAFTVVFSAVLIALAFVYPAITYIKSYLADGLQTGGVSDLVFTSLALFLSFLFYYFMYRTIPNKRMPAYVINVSTGLSVVLIEISRRIFAWYLLCFTTYTKFYGAYALMATIAIWVFYLVMIILLSAELAKYMYDLRELRRAEKAESAK